MTSNNNTTTIVTTNNNNKKFTISLTKGELDNIQKQFLDELDEMLDKIRRRGSNRRNNILVVEEKQSD